MVGMAGQVTHSGSDSSRPCLIREPLQRANHMQISRVDWVSTLSSLKHLQTTRDTRCKRERRTQKPTEALHLFPSEGWGKNWLFPVRTGSFVCVREGTST